MRHVHPPPPATLRHLQSRDTTGWTFTTVTAAATIAGIWLSASGPAPAWVLGQLLLGLAMVEWFVLLHECGHRTLFRTRAANTFVGHVAGLVAAIPYDAWIHVHRQHHQWTGWQDLDPTTATLAPRRRSALVQLIVRVCWKFWVPLFSVAYRLGNFWTPRMFGSYVRGRVPGRAIGGLLAAAAIYACVVWYVGPFETMRVAGVATLLAFVVEDVLLISQHTHVPMEQSGGQHVMPHRALDQERYTRSLRLPAMLSRLALHFDAHELHHMYPFVPGYRLREIAYEPANEVGWWRWIRAARAFPGDALLFQSRRETGFRL